MFLILLLVNGEWIVNFWLVKMDFESYLKDLKRIF